MRPVPAVRGGGEHDELAVRRPCGRQVFAAGAELPTETGLLHELRPGEDVPGRCVRVERLHEQMRPPVVEPVVPQANRRRVVHARVVLPAFALGRRGTIRRVGERAGVDHAGEKDGAAIRTPQRTSSAGRDVRHALCFATTTQVQYVDLRRVIAFAARAERDPPAVGAPIDPALAAFAVRQPPRLRTAIQEHDPEIAHLLAFGIGRLRHAEHDPAPVGAYGRRRQAFHQKDVLMGDRVALLSGERRERRQQPGGAGEQSDRAHGMSYRM